MVRNHWPVVERGKSEGKSFVKSKCAFIACLSMGKWFI